ncbi:MAG: Gfo/Idh/MocA family oxidoreductase [Akkermansiaceae bacterium]|nr:Gfo/Idh/MocA family oxidoreductase [Akkermansiaceae bacterium]
MIGTGGKATGGARNFVSGTTAQITALADPNRLNMEAFRNAFQVPAERCYPDFNDLLALKDIDAVLVGTPDHWHVPVSIAAAKAGKHVYCEKPLGVSIAEGQALVKAIRENGVVFQHGTQLRSQDCTRIACELVRNGYFGNVRKVIIGSPPGLAIGPVPPQPVPPTLDWKMWAGPGTPVDYRDVIVGGIPGKGLRGWYFMKRFSPSGWIAGYAVHDIDLAHWGLGLEHTGPVRVEGRGTFPKEGLFDTVLDYELTFTYADGRQILVTDTGKNRHGVKFIHENGRDWVFCRSELAASNRDLLRPERKDSDIKLYASRLHELNFIECIQSGKPTITPAEVAHRSTSVCHLGAICLDLGRPLEWNPTTETFVNDDAANQRLAI